MENIKGNYLDQKLGNFPLNCECLDYLQQRTDLTQVLGNIGGDKIILSGQNTDGSEIVFVKTTAFPKGEILPVEAGQGLYLYVESEDIEVTISEEDKFPKAHTKRFLKYSENRVSGKENFLVSEFWKIKSNKTVYQALQAEIETRKREDAGLVKIIDNEVITLRTEIEKEASNKNTAIQTAIKNEVADRNTAINNEATARNKAIQNAINSEVSARNKAIQDATELSEVTHGEIRTLIKTEQTARENADAQLLTKINNMSGVPRGVILAWYGTYNDVPEGWHICNGKDGTPDLRGRFLLGAWDGAVLTAVEEKQINEFRRYKTVSNMPGGLSTHSCTLSLGNLPKHSHEVRLSATVTEPLNRNGFPSRSVDSSTGSNDDSGRRAYWRGTVTSTLSVGTSSKPQYTQLTGNNEPVSYDVMPPFMAMLWIMKM